MLRFVELARWKSLRNSTLYRLDRQNILCVALLHQYYLFKKVKFTLVRHWGSVQAVRPIGGVEV
jgi:hypothetical protein